MIFHFISINDFSFNSQSFISLGEIIRNISYNFTVTGFDDKFQPPKSIENYPMCEYLIFIGSLSLSKASFFIDTLLSFIEPEKTLVSICF